MRTNLFAETASPQFRFRRLQGRGRAAAPRFYSLRRNIQSYGICFKIDPKRDDSLIVVIIDCSCGLEFEPHEPYDDLLAVIKEAGETSIKCPKSNKDMTFKRAHLTRR